MDKIKVLVVDDSSLMRKLISKIVNSDPQMEVVDTAMNGVFALQKIQKHNPDIILLDIEMPEMDGLEFLRKRREFDISTPVIVLSSLGRSKPHITMQSLDLGAKDFIMKPSGTISMDIETISEEIIAKIKYFHQKDPQRAQKFSIPSEIMHSHPMERTIDKTEEVKRADFVRASSQTAVKESVSIDPYLVEKHKEEMEKKLSLLHSINIVGIGISTGGPNALRQILPEFPKDFNLPILIVQHMPPGFTKEFAMGLNEICSLDVKEAEDEEPIKKGTIYIAPGDKHMIVGGKEGNARIILTDGPLSCGHKPSVEELFISMAKTYQNKSLAIIMTGMGKDGANGIKHIYQKGGITLAQDETSCVVFGMPKVAIMMGGIDEVISLKDIPNRVLKIIYRVNG